MTKSGKKCRQWKDVKEAKFENVDQMENICRFDTIGFNTKNCLAILLLVTYSMILNHGVLSTGLLNGPISL